jgi:hypothetical protein
VSTILELYDSAKIQRIDEAVINMEYNGFMVDAEYCARGYAVACQDEQAVLESLRGAVRGKDLTALVGQPDPDAIWTSSVQLPKLLE